MADERQAENAQLFHYENGVPVFEKRLTELEDKATEAELRDKTYNDRQVQINSRVAFFTGLLFLTSLLTSGIAVWQGFISQRSAKAAEQAAILTRQQLGMSEGALKSTVEQFRLDERAWVVIDPIKPTLMNPRVENFPALFRYEIYPRNVGKTVARDVVIKAESSTASIEFGRRNDWVKSMQDKYLLNKFRETGTNKPVIVPDSPGPNFLAPNSAYAAPLILTAQEPMFPPNQHLVSYLIGRIDYCDQFGVKHWTKFCFYVARQSGEVWNCQAGNETDKNPEVPVPGTACSPAVLK